ncbi:MAG: RNA 2'-phosphotransferase, partial [Chloroflexota bacterium]|nr:RNA 2'-phosphotransferase [Chloroflexota bacterium]
MTDPKHLTRLSKFLAVLLRHEPQKFGLTLDSEGYADTDAVWAQIVRRYGNQYTHADLLRVVEGDSSGKKRYEIVGRKIRALYGHSSVEVSYAPAVPPELLYHGTVQAAMDSIRQHGLMAQARQFVHLTTSEERARTVAGRHAGDTVLLTIRAGDAHRAGIVFYHPEA